ncbi:MAG: efflux transporter outer membrane subunit [Rikenellaceae bacterium]
MRHIKYITSSLLVALTMSNCGIYSKYQRSAEVEALTNDLYQYSETPADTSIASLSWRELFTDPALQSLIEQALAQNTDLNVARLNVEQVEIALSTARKAFLPSLSLEPQGSISSFNVSTTKTYNVSLTSSWEIDIFGKLHNAKEQNKALLEQSEAYAQAVQTSLIATIAQSYYSLLMLDEQLQISQDTRENWEKNLRVMNAMKIAGRINETSVLQSEASSIALNSSIVTIKEQIAALENSLSQLLAQPTSHIERGDILSVEFSDKLSTGLPIELLSNRPDVRMAESYLAEMFYATAEACSSLYPSLTLSGSAGYTNSSGVVINPGDMLYNLAGSILQPIFNRGTLKAQLKISKSQQEQALLQFKQSILDAGVEVNNAISELQSSRERLRYGVEQITVLEKTVTKTELLMRHGNVTTLDVLVAQLSLLQTQLSFSTEKFNQTQGIINLYRALGGGEK